MFKKTYFIADIAANHDGSLKRAKKLIKLCAKAGADAAKFQHFKAKTIVSDEGFKKIGKISHQKKWKKSIFQVYKSASINFSWTQALKKECDKAGIDFMTAPYDLEYIDKVNKFIKYFKIGSGDITWKESLEKISRKKKTIMLATGASSFTDVVNAVNLIRKKNKKKIILMQCNTNYTNSTNNFNYINLKVLNQYRKFFGNKIILGLSDHTPGHATVLGAVTLGAKVIEKHFTDNNNRNGPDHKFSMNPKTWKIMVDETRNLENALGNGKKIIEKNEKQSVIIQRRGCWSARKIYKGEVFNKQMVKLLRPCPKQSISPFLIEKYFGKKIKVTLSPNQIIKEKYFDFK